jgi:hypothetical protein
MERDLYKLNEEIDVIREEHYRVSQQLKGERDEALKQAHKYKKQLEKLQNAPLD